MFVSIHHENPRLHTPVDTIAIVGSATASLFIVNPIGALDSIAGWFSTHPSTEERVARLRRMRARSTLLPANRWI